MRRELWLGLLAVALLTACDDGSLRAFEPKVLTILGGNAGRGPEAEAGAGRGGTAGAEASGAGRGGTAGAAEASAGAAGAGAELPVSPLLIDDFEDGDTRAKSPLGWWYPVNDKTSAQGFGVEPMTADSTSVYALRTHGSGFRSWGSAVGVDLKGDAGPLDLRSYDELCFLGRVEAGSSSQVQIHWLQGTQHYTHDVSLSEAWTRYCLPLTDFMGQPQEVFVPSELIALQFFFAPNEPFQVWLDDVEVVRN
jgi:hypothetical protein